MPTYEYACLSCGRHSEVVQGFSDEPLRTCEVCGGPLRRVFHPVGIVLKGSGFYSTDNRGSRRRGAEQKKETPAESKPSAEKSAPPSGETSKAASGDTSSSKKKT